MTCSSLVPDRTVVLADLLSRRDAPRRPGPRHSGPRSPAPRRAEHRRVLRAKSFAAKRVAYVLELAGSCMMIAVFLAMALFL